MEGFYEEMNLQKKKSLLCCSCNPKKNAIKSHLEPLLHKRLALYSSKYENFIVLGDFNVGMDNSDMTNALLRNQHAIKILKINPA